MSSTGPLRLRPISHQSSSSSASSTPDTSSRNAPHHRRSISSSSSATLSTAAPSSSGPRRPLSPGTLRDVDLAPAMDPSVRSYPPPPTGHDLMAMFPPPAPANFSPELRPGPTSGYFQREERQFFAQAGKEIVRAHHEADLDASASAPPTPSRSRQSGQWHPSGSSISASQSAPPRAVHVTTVSPSVPHPNSGPSTQQPPMLLRSSMDASQGHQMMPRMPPSSPYGPGSGAPPPHEPEYDQDDPDEAWRRPIPHAERRRAGKHTKRVVVKS